MGFGNFVHGVVRWATLTPTFLREDSWFPSAEDTESEIFQNAYHRVWVVCTLALTLALLVVNLQWSREVGLHRRVRTVLCNVMYHGRPRLGRLLIPNVSGLGLGCNRREKCGSPGTPTLELQ